MEEATVDNKVGWKKAAREIWPIIVVVLLLLIALASVFVPELAPVVEYAATALADAVIGTLTNTPGLKLTPLVTAPGG